MYLWSFEPVFVLTAQPNPPHSFKTSIEPKQNKGTSQNIKKHQEKKKQRTYGRLGLFLPSLPNLTLLVILKHRQNLNRMEIISYCIKKHREKKRTYLKPKQRVWCCLGPFLSSTPNPTPLVLLKHLWSLNKIKLISQISIKHKRKKNMVLVWVMKMPQW